MKNRNEEMRGEAITLGDREKFFTFIDKREEKSFGNQKRSCACDNGK